MFVHVVDFKQFFLREYYEESNPQVQIFAFALCNACLTDPEKKSRESVKNGNNGRDVVPSLNQYFY